MASTAKSFNVKEYEPQSFKSFRIQSTKKKSAAADGNPSSHDARPLKIPSRPNSANPKSLKKLESVTKSVTTFSHNQYCSFAPPGMITKSLAFSPRHRNTTFGKSNRIPFLRKIQESVGEPSVRPPYPPSYHGPCGEGMQFALGLTLAGSAGPNRILGPVCTYGDGKDYINRPRGMSELKDGPDLNMRAKSFAATYATFSSGDRPYTSSMKQILMRDVDLGPSSKKSVEKIPRIRTALPDSKLIVHTRYSANTDWARDTKMTIQASPGSDFAISEAQRLTRGSFVDELDLRKKQAYRLKLQHLSKYCT
jgi:hypothetical protein